MIARLARLFKELQLRHWRDTRSRLFYAFSQKSGRLRRQFAPAPSAWTEVPSDVIEVANLSVFSANQEVLCDVDVSCQPPGSSYHFFGVSVSPGAGSTNWHASIVREAAWPKNHWTEIPFKSLGQLGDIKYAWEPARMQFLLGSGIEFSRSESPSLAQHIRAVLTEFWDQNPREIGVHYISNMEIGIRSLVWLWLCACCGKSPAFDDDFRNRLSRQLFLNGRHLHKKIAFTASTGRNNHLIGDAASLLVISLVFNDCAEAGKWNQLAGALLRECLDEQFLPSGMHFERSFGYLCFVMEFLWAALLAHGIPDDLRRLIEQKLAAATSVIESFGAPDGSLPAINDDDDGYVFFPVRSRIQQREWLIGLADNRLDRGTLSSTEPAGPTESSEFSMFSHSSGSMVFVDHHGDPFPDSGHNHASLLQVLFWLDGNAVLVDSGTYGYNDTGSLRDMFRGTSCHNTVTLDGEGQAEPSRGFGWLSMTRPGVCTSERTAISLTFAGEHSCFSDATHRRHVFWSEEHGVLAIRDAILCTDGRNAKQFWHFAPSINVRMEGTRLFVAAEASRLHVHTFAKDEQLDLFTDRTELPECAFSPAYGVITTKPVLVRSWKTDGDPRWTVFARDEDVRSKHSNGIETVEGPGWRITFSPEQDRIVFSTN